MQETSWLMDILTSPFIQGLALGLLLCLVFWVRAYLRTRELTGNIKKLREHLHTKLEIDAEEMERRKQEIDKLKEERDNLRNMAQVMNQKPGRQEIRQAQVYQRAIDIMFAKAPGFAPAWQITLKEAEEEMLNAERGIIPFFKRMTGSPSRAHEDYEVERRKALEMKSGS